MPPSESGSLIPHPSVLTPGSPTPASRNRLRAVLGFVVFLPWRMLDRIGAAAERHIQNVMTALVQIWANKARSVLTTLGIIIAVTSTITVVSFVQGFGNYVTNMLRNFGTNFVFVVPYEPPGSRGMMLGRITLDIDDIRTVSQQCDKVRRITPVVFSQVTIEYGRERAENIELQGTTEDFQPIRNFFPRQGRFLGPIDVDNNTSVCVLGQEVLKLLEVDDAIVGDYVFINSQRFLVLGVLEPKGRMFDENQDRTVLVPYTTALKMNPFLVHFMPFAVEAVSEDKVEECTLQMTRVLRERHGLQPGDPNDFMIFRQDEFLRDFQRVQVVATSILVGIVGISLIVGGVGIMNVMLVSVTERTREIGLRKSVGGRRRDILTQFLTEAVVLSTVGGAIGIALGYIICYIASLHPSMVEVVVPIWAVALALGFSAAVGIVFGLIPAFKAAILNPIDALRYE